MVSNFEKGPIYASPPTPVQKSGQYGSGQYGNRYTAPTTAYPTPTTAAMPPPPAPTYVTDPASQLRY